MHTNDYILLALLTGDQISSWTIRTGIFEKEKKQNNKNISEVQHDMIVHHMKRKPHITICKRKYSCRLFFFFLSVSCFAQKDCKIIHSFCSSELFAAPVMFSTADDNQRRGDIRKLIFSCSVCCVTKLTPSVTLCVFELSVCVTKIHIKRIDIFLKYKLNENLKILIFGLVTIVFKENKWDTSHFKLDDALPETIITKPTTRANLACVTSL